MLVERTSVGHTFGAALHNRAQMVSKRFAKRHSAYARADRPIDSVGDGRPDHPDTGLSSSAVTRVARERPHVHVDLPWNVGHAQHCIAVEVAFTIWPSFTVSSSFKDTFNPKIMEPCNCALTASSFRICPQSKARSSA